MSSAQLDVVQATGHFLAVTGDEGDGGTAIKQLNGGVDLIRPDTDFYGQLGQDFLHAQFGKERRSGQVCHSAPTDFWSALQACFQPSVTNFRLKFQKNNN